MKNKAKQLPIAILRTFSPLFRSLISPPHSSQLHTKSHPTHLGEKYTPSPPAPFRPTLRSGLHSTLLSVMQHSGQQLLYSLHASNSTSKPQSTRSAIQIPSPIQPFHQPLSKQHPRLSRPTSQPSRTPANVLDCLWLQLPAKSFPIELEPDYHHAQI